MRPDGTLEDWDEIYLPGYRETAQRTDPDTGKVWRQKRDGGARIDELFPMVHDRLRAYQGYWVKSDIEPFRGQFQFARYLDKGHKVYNETTGDVYTITDLIYDPDGTFKGEVRLSGGTDPVETNRLRLDPKNEVVFTRLAQRSEVASAKFTEGSERTDEPAPFTDTVEYSIRRSEPGTVGKRPFDRERQALPLLREPEMEDIVDAGYVVESSGWWFDNIVQFDCFARTNDRLHGRRLDNGGRVKGLVEWFQDFMQKYRWVFLWNGIQQILEWQGLEDAPIERFRNDMVHRPLLFYVRTERLSFARIRRIEQIDVLVNIGSPLGTSAQSGCPVPTGQIGAIINDLGLYGTL